MLLFHTRAQVKACKCTQRHMTRLCANGPCRPQGPSGTHIHIPPPHAHLSSQTRVCDSTFVYRGHVSSVSSVAVQPSSYMIASASWDRTVRVWATGACACLSVCLYACMLTCMSARVVSAEDDEYDVPVDATKRRKVTNQSDSTMVKVCVGLCLCAWMHVTTAHCCTQRPLGVFHGSTAPIKSVVWPTTDTIYRCVNANVNAYVL